MEGLYKQVFWPLGYWEKERRGLFQIFEKRRDEGVCFSRWAIPIPKIKAHKTVGASCINLSVHFQLVMHCLCSFSSRGQLYASAKEKLCSVFVLRFRVQILAFILTCKVPLKILNLLYSNLWKQMSRPFLHQGSYETLCYWDTGCISRLL